MKIHNIILPLIASSMIFVSCGDQKMEWYTHADHNPVVSSEIPLALAEKIANYDYIKTYMAQYMPGVPLGVGLTADKYLTDSAYASVCDLNFQQFVTGNAMKHASVVKNDGSLDLTTVFQFLTKVPSNAEVFSHNFIWHTQQNQTYLKSLISPTVKIESDGDVANILTNGDFETGNKSPWGSWGNSSTTSVESGIGYNGTYGAKLVNPTDASEYSAQFAYTLTDPLVVGKTYVIKVRLMSFSSMRNPVLLELHFSSRCKTARPMAVRRGIITLRWVPTGQNSLMNTLVAKMMSTVSFSISVRLEPNII